MTQPTSSSRSEKALTKALSTMLKPLVRLLIQQNITYTGLLTLLKSTFIEVAETSFALKGKKLTDSRISLLTGVHRGEVKKIRENQTNAPSEQELKASISAQIMSVWLGHQGYLDSKGRPVPIFRSSQAGSPSFDELVYSVSKDKHPRSIFDDWLNQGLITCTKTDQAEMVELVHKSYVPTEEFEEKLFFAGKNIGCHLSTVAYNLENQSPPMFDRAVYYSDLTEQSIAQLEALTREKMMALLTELNQTAQQLQMQDQNKPEADYQMHVGGYFNHSLPVRAGEYTTEHNQPHPKSPTSNQVGS